MKVYTLLVIDRHCDPQVMVFRERPPAEEEMTVRCLKYWKEFFVKYRRDIKGNLRVTCEDVGEMEVQEHEI